MKCIRLNFQCHFNKFFIFFKCMHNFVLFYAESFCPSDFMQVMPPKDMVLMNNSYNECSKRLFSSSILEETSGMLLIFGADFSSSIKSLFFDFGGIDN